MWYLILIVVILALGGLSQGLIRRAYRKYASRGLERRQTGSQVARSMLEAQGLGDVALRCVEGRLKDRYDLNSCTVFLSDEQYHGCSVAAIAIACHECGHALQHVAGNALLGVRSRLTVPIRFCACSWVVFIVIGLVLDVALLRMVGIALLALVVVFQVAVLPVELDASNRALDYIKMNDVMNDHETGEAAIMLRAAALTYLSVALMGIIDLLIRVVDFYISER